MGSVWFLSFLFWDLLCSILYHVRHQHIPLQSFNKIIFHPSSLVCTNTACNGQTWIDWEIADTRKILCKWDFSLQILRWNKTKQADQQLQHGNSISIIRFLPEDFHLIKVSSEERFQLSLHVSIESVCIYASKIASWYLQNFIKGWSC